MNPIINKVRQFIVNERLLSADGKHLVALSGGADSVALLLILKQLGYDIEAIHCHFHLRGKESDRDETFCLNLCEQQQIPLHRIHFDTRSYADLHKMSIEMAARELRYQYFEQLRKDIHAQTICVAHHREDSVETLLINLIRGTGIHGLQGIAAKNENIIRPLLNVTRQEIEDYLISLNQTFVTDSTNLETEYTRNKIRLEVLPLLQDINPSAEENIYKTSVRLREAAKVFDKSIQETLQTTVDGNRMSIQKLLTTPSPEYVLYCWLKPYGFNSTQIEQIHSHLSAHSGKGWHSTTHELVIDRGDLLVQPRTKESGKTWRFPEEGTYHLDESRQLKIIREVVHQGFQPSKEQSHVHIDSSKVHFPLTLRPVRKGDRFYPFGMNGSKLLSDYMTDRKMSVFEKRSQYVLTDAEDHIIWVVNERIDNRFRITERTISALHLILLPPSPQIKDE